MAEENTLYSIKDLVVEYSTRSGALRAVDEVSFEIKKGEVLGLVGESGCGKSTLGKAIMRMIEEPGKIVSGKLIFDNLDLMEISNEEMRKIRGSRISMIFQDPMTSLNPVQRISGHLIETVHAHDFTIDRKTARSLAAKLIDRLGIRSERLDDYPHQLSGGMRQRVMISLGLVLNADLIIADEATTSLDVIVEAKLVDQLKQIQDEFGVTILVITHNIALVAQIADRLAVMYAGRIVELGSIYEVFEHPKHPYTQGLLDCIPTIKLENDEELYKMPGEPPNLINPPSGCRFHPRCPQAMPICSRERPKLEDLGGEHFVHCWLYQDHPSKEATGNEVSS
ncbi:MAG: ABC transporter ATP-binding protein [Anaerolineales bacterium]|jgi:peptide/nickel transport system ATP-binding protein